jgi:hypothetical protein
MKNKPKEKSFFQVFAPVLAGSFLIISAMTNDSSISDIFNVLRVVAGLGFISIGIYRYSKK